MRYLYQSFSARKSDQVEVSFDQPTKVKLMTKREFEKYRKSKTYTYWGGDKTDSPAVMDIPTDGKWVVVVEKGTYFNPIEISASISIIKGGAKGNISTSVVDSIDTSSLSDNVDEEPVEDSSENISTEELVNESEESTDEEVQSAIEEEVDEMENTTTEEDDTKLS